MLDRLGGMLCAIALGSLMVAAGLALLGLGARRTKSVLRWTPLELFTSSVLAGGAVATLLGLALAYAGLFGAWTLCALLVLLLLLLAPRAFRGGSPFEFESLFKWEALALLVALAVMGFSVVQRFDEVEGLRDPGVYVASGIELSRTGDLGWHDPLAQKHGFSKVSHLFQDWGDFHEGKPRWERFAGFYMDRPDSGHVQPQFLHGYEIWIALAYQLAGPQATQCVNAGFAFLALLAFFLVLRRCVSASAGGFAVFLAALCPAELWFARFPGNEVMVQALLWGGVLLYARALDGSKRLAADQTAEAPAERGASSELWLALLLFSTAALIKFAAWGFLLVLALDMGFSSAKGTLRGRGSRLWFAVVLAAAFVYFHARVFGHFYLFGSWSFSAKRMGVPFWFLPVIYIGGVAAAFSAGRIAAHGFSWVLTRRRGELWHKTVYPGAVFGTCALFGLQMLVYKAETGHVDVWKERTNLVELALYFSRAGFVLGVLGLGWMYSRMRSPAKGLLVLLLALSSVFIVRRNLDAVHPWACRRWLPFLVPVFCAGMAYPASVLWEKRRLLARGVALGWVALLGALLLHAAPQLTLSRDYHGLIPQFDKFAEKLLVRDLVLMQPTGALAQFGPYLKARFDVDAYVQPATEEAWQATRPLAVDAASQKRRVLYLSDTPLTQPLGTRHFLDHVASCQFDFSALPDGYRRLEDGMTTTSVPIHIYQIDPWGLPAGWHPGWEPPLERREPSQPPLTLKMDAAARTYLSHFYDTNPVGEGRYYRWTDGNGQIRVGQLLKLPLSQQRVRFTFRVHSGRSDDAITTLGVHCYLDLHDKTRAQKLGEKVFGPEWSDFCVEVEASRLQEDSVLELQSLRPPVGKKIGWGQLGVIVEELRIE